MTATPVGNSIPLTGDAKVDGILQGSSWVFSGAHTLTYSLHSTSGSSWGAYSTTLTQAFAAWSAVADISFTKISTSADYTKSTADLAITLAGYSDSGALATGTFPDPAFADAILDEDGQTRTQYPNPEGDIFFYNFYQEFDAANSKPGGAMLETMLHEIGHTLGLKHPHDDGGNDRPLETGYYDNGYWTVMSYNDPQLMDGPYDTTASTYYATFAKGFQATPMPLDILAIQAIYGANMSYHTGNDTYNLTYDGIVKTIWDAGGIDTINAAALKNSVTIVLQGGSFIDHGGDGYSTTAIAFNVTIENATGTAYNDTLTGNDADNVLNGGGGADKLTGGLGNDTYYVDNVGDVIIENAGEGNDTVYTAFSTNLATAYTSIENAVLTGSAALTLTGTSGVNILTGNSGANIIDGGAGADTMAGGAGNDTFMVDNSGDIVSDTSGSDTVMSSVSYTLGTGLEKLIITASGNMLATGNASANVLTVNDSGGNSTLDGGAGADSMTGGDGDDYYIVDNAGDKVFENANEGVDTIRTSVAYTLAANVENLILTGTANLNLKGNDSVNQLTGNSGNNTLDGGIGGDTMAGGAGNDTYIADDYNDRIIELDGEGIDTVKAANTFSLAPYAYVENAILTSKYDDDLTGNALNNTLTGNAGSNHIDGGAGADRMIGGAGNDYYIVDNIGDVVVDTSGRDSITASISYTLGTGIEELHLTGTDNLTGTGNTLANLLVGNDGNNTLDGGTGNDTMQGGLGDDTYIVNATGDVVTELAGAGTDTVLSSASYVLGDNIENLVLTAKAIAGTGNALNNTITGNDSANTLDGGAGADHLIGGLGNDIYIVDNAGDVVDETSTLAKEHDTVKSYIDYTLGANLENLTLMGTVGHTGIGNELANTMVGTSGDDTLDGMAGADRMSGGLGNDLYIVDNARDVIVESGVGIDSVHSSVDWTLGSNLENLTLTGTALKGTGNSLANIITGNAMDNTLSGGSGNDTLDGGLGHDIMTGGAGKDTFVISTMDGTSDTVTDFSVAQGDVLDIHSILQGFDALVSNITDFLQITTSGKDSVVMVDADGAGTTYAMTQVALFTNVINLTDEQNLYATGHIIA